jgi:hypothetical protein
MVVHLFDSDGGAPHNEVKSKRSIIMASTVKIRTIKAIDLLKDSIQAKKAELASFNKAMEQYKKDYKVWADATIKEAKKAPLSSGEILNGTSAGARVSFTFKATTAAPKAPNKYVQVRESRGYSYRKDKKELLQEQIEKSEALLKMLNLTEDEFVGAAVYKDIASML